MTNDQAAAVTHIVTRFGCEDDFLVEAEPFGQPRGHIVLSFGLAKGRARALVIDPDGRPRPIHNHRESR